MISRNTDNPIPKNTMSLSVELKQTDSFGSGSFMARTVSCQFGCIAWVGSGTDNKIVIGMTSLNE